MVLSLQTTGWFEGFLGLLKMQSLSETAVGENSSMSPR